MISDRAKQYLATLDRYPAVTERSIIEDAFAAAGIPVLDPVVDFQVDFGGYVELYGLNKFVWGILHSQPDPDSFFAPDRLDVTAEDGEIFVTCANCHLSDHWFLDARGALYWCFPPPLAASFPTKIERDAISWSLGKGTREVTPAGTAAELIEALIPRIADGLVPEASDAYESLYLYNGIYAAVKDDQIIVHLYEERGRALLAGIPVTVATAAAGSPGRGNP